MLAWLLNQADAPAVESALEEAEAGNLHLFMSWINVGESYYIIAKRHPREKAEEFLHRLPSLPMRIVLPNEEDILAARIKAAHPVALPMPSPSRWPKRNWPA